MGCIKMTVKELKEILECLIEDGNGDYKILSDVYYTHYECCEIDKSEIFIDKENKEVWI